MSVKPVFVIFTVSLFLRIYLIQTTDMFGYDPYAYLTLARSMMLGEDTGWAYPQVTFADRLAFSSLAYSSIFIEQIFGLPATTVSRYLMALVGAAGVVTGYLITLTVSDRLTALIASVLISTSPLYLAYSTTLYPDVFYYTISSACLYFFLSRRNIGRLSFHYSGLFFFVLSLLTRIYALLLIIPILLTTWLDKSDNWYVVRIMKYFSIIIIVYLVYFSFIVGTPFIYLKYTRFNPLEQVYMFNPNLLWVTFWQLNEQLTSAIFYSALAGIAIRVIARDER